MFNNTHMIKNAMIIYTADMGILPIKPPPIFWNSSSEIKTGRPPVMMYEIPRIIFIVANVTINGGIFIFVMINPFIAPNRVPAERDNSTAKTAGTWNQATSTVVRQPANDIKDPTDRSIPPVRITKVIPNAHSALVVIVLKTFI